MRIKILIIALAIFFIGAVLIFAGYGWFVKKQQRVLTGAANPIFPYRDYTIAELNKLYPQYPNVDVQTTQTPEQTHAKFLSALKKQDFDEAVKCCFKQGDWEKMKKNLEEIKKKGYLEQMIGDLSNVKFLSKFNLDEINNTTYYYNSERGGKKMGSTIDFVKNNQGLWLIESL